MNEEWIIAVKVIYCSQKLYSLHVRQFDMICSASRNKKFRVLTLGWFCSLENLANCILCILFSTPTLYSLQTRASRLSMAACCVSLSCSPSTTIQGT